VGSVVFAGGRGVIEALEGAGDIAWHGDVECAGSVVPREVNSAVSGASPVDTYFVLELQGVDGC
jgi:hypothetical protein